MPFRARLKKTFSRRSSTSSSPREDSTGTDQSQFYQPGEKIPYKYRRPVEKEHKDKLESFSWTKAWRRKSHQSQYSPMGSRMPSRAGSAIAPPVGVRLGGSIDEGMRPSVDKRKHSRPSEELPPSEIPAHQPLETIQSIQHDSPTEESGKPFTQEDLNEAVKKAHIS